MRKFKMGLITVAASAAMFIPAGLASASTQSASTQWNPPGDCGIISILCVDVLNNNNVVVKTGDILSPDITSVCILSGNLDQNLVLLNGGSVLTCSDGSHKMKKH
jgi:hypothetical protein